MIYHPAPYPEGDWQPAGIAVEDARFQSADGTELHGLFLPHPQPRAVMLFTHGNAGNITSRINLLRTLNEQHGVAVMTFDYRGYGKSEGQPSEAGILRDARAARTWLAARTNIPAADIVLFGRSLGGAVAIDLAAQDGARGLILVSTFTSLPAVGAHHLRWLPTSLLMSERFDSLSKIGQYSGPVLHAHGKQDELIPLSQAEELHAAMPGPKQFLLLPGDHNTSLTPEFHASLDAFLQRLPPAARWSY